MGEKKFKSEKKFESTFIAYLEECKRKADLPNIAGFCVFANIGRRTFYDYKDVYPLTYKRINDMLEDRTINSKSINDTFKIFYMKNKFGYKDRIENVNAETSYENLLKKAVDKDEY